MLNKTVKSNGANNMEVLGFMLCCTSTGSASPSHHSHADVMQALMCNHAKHAEVMGFGPVGVVELENVEVEIMKKWLHE